MAHVFKLPDLGEGVESGDVINLHVKQGDTVEKDQPLMEIESGKATLDLPSPVAGTISELHVEAGATVSPGQKIATIEESDGGGADTGGDETEQEQGADAEADGRPAQQEKQKGKKQEKPGKKREKPGEKQEKQKTTSRHDERSRSDRQGETDDA
ncbi:MAG: biotin/lipoyl-containing protein, partial [Planctomycetota bacterium]